MLALLVIVIVRFNARANPTPSRTTHNTLIEVLWTVVPVVILVVIAVPSFRLLFLQLNIPPADLTVKATGKQWYWSYSYPDHGKFEFDSLMLQERSQEAASRSRRGCWRSTTRWWCRSTRSCGCMTTGADVIHAFAVPSFGIKIDAIPGRLNETWFKATREGIYLRPVLGTVRQGSRLHADRGPGGERGGVRRLGRGGQEEIRRRRRPRRRPAWRRCERRSNEARAAR